MGTFVFLTSLMLSSADHLYEIFLRTILYEIYRTRTIPTGKRCYQVEKLQNRVEIELKNYRFAHPPSNSVRQSATQLGDTITRGLRHHVGRTINRKFALNGKITNCLVTKKLVCHNST